MSRVFCLMGVRVGGWGGGREPCSRLSHVSFYPMMTDRTDISLDSVCNDDKYNFLHKILSEKDDVHSFTNTFSEDLNSPYNDCSFICNYLDEPSYISKYSNSKNLSCCTLNVQSLPAKFNDLSDLISHMLFNASAPDVLCIQELWQIADPSLLSLPSYHNIVFKLRHITQGGGVGIYIKDHINFKVLDGLSVFVDRIFESIFIEVSLPDSNKKILIGSVYRPGSAHPTLSNTEQFTQFIEIFSNVLSDAHSKFENVYIFGDFNLDLIKLNKNKQVKEYVDLLFSFGFLQIVTRPTRLSSSSATLIDHIITNVSHPVYETSILTASISDHFPIFFNIPFNRPPIKARTVESRNFSDANIAKFQNAIRNFNWNHVSDSNCAQEAYNNFNSSFMLLYNMYFPVVVTKINRNFHKLDPWMTNGILTSRQRKNHLYSVSLKNPSPVNSNNFKKFRNIYNTVLRASKKLYYEYQLKNNLTNLKKTWQIINTAIKKPGKKTNLFQTYI